MDSLVEVPVCSTLAMSHRTLNLQYDNLSKGDYLFVVFIWVRIRTRIRPLVDPTAYAQIQ